LTSECRASAGVCDVAENCSDASDDCPADGFVTAGTECAASNGECDLAEYCTGSSAACPDDGDNLTTECRPAADICDLPEYCSNDSDDCPEDVTLPCEECLTHTGGYWGTHPWATSAILEFQPVVTCGLEINNAEVYTDGNRVDTPAYGSAIEDICFDGKRYSSRVVGYSPQLLQLIRQCTVAAINMSATAYYEGSCDGYVIPENECLQKTPTCDNIVEGVGTCTYGPNTACATDDDCTYNYCSQGGADTCEIDDDCPNNPYALWAIPDVMAACCDELCTSSASGSEISSSGCIEAIDWFNNSEDTFDIAPDLCEFSPDENCSADSDN
jgi:hypothetical protein